MTVPQALLAYCLMAWAFEAGRIAIGFGAFVAGVVEVTEEVGNPFDPPWSPGALVALGVVFCIAIEPIALPYVVGLVVRRAVSGGRVA